jgi:hypothetical protein
VTGSRARERARVFFALCPVESGSIAKAPFFQKNGVIRPERLLSHDTLLSSARYAAEVIHERHAKNVIEAP